MNYSSKWLPSEGEMRSNAYIGNNDYLNYQVLLCDTNDLVVSADSLHSSRYTLSFFGKKALEKGKFKTTQLFDIQFTATYKSLKEEGNARIHG